MGNLSVPVPPWQDDGTDAPADQPAPAAATPGGWSPDGLLGGLDLSGHGGGAGSLALLMDQKDIADIPGLGGVRPAGWSTPNPAGNSNSPAQGIDEVPSTVGGGQVPTSPGPITIGQVGPDHTVIGWAPGTEPIRSLLERISIGEGTSDAAAAQAHYPSGSGYDVAYGDKQTQKPISQMTLDEVAQLQGQMGDHTPVGKYQITKGTLEDLEKHFDLPGSEIFSPDLQDRMARRLLETHGFNDYVDGRIDGQKLEQNLAPVWGSLENPVTGKTAGGYAPRTTMPQFQDALSQVVRSK
jgi:muramidase (phage lysozyme)